MFFNTERDPNMSLYHIFKTVIQEANKTFLCFVSCFFFKSKQAVEGRAWAQIMERPNNTNKYQNISKNIFKKYKGRTKHLKINNFSLLTKVTKYITK